jgi:hypothetical protein
MAPSFNLFNQSFDSFGDAQYFNVDSTLQNDSFGMVRSNSIENEGGATQLLQKTASSGGNFSQQVLNGTGSGALTIGYSPVNSFGTTTASMGPRRGGNMMVLGGSDGRAASPTQVLGGMYRSYSGASGHPRQGPGSGPLDDSHMRMSVGSFGSHAMPYGRPYGDPTASPYYNYSMGPSRSHESHDRTPPFYLLLRKYKNAFKDCMFLLPGLKAALLESPLSDRDQAASSNSDAVPVSQSTSLWKTIIRLSICAFILTLFIWFVSD